MTRGCWCQFWHLRGRAYDLEQGEANRARLRAQIEARESSALLVYADGIPIGWCRLGPKETFDRLEHSPRLQRVDDEDVWSVVCFYVHPSATRRGVASALLDAAVAHATDRGVTIVEGYPVRAGHPTIDAHTGYLPMFLAAGFEIVRPAGRRSIVRRELH